MPTVLITGANRGIGLELTRQYLADGWFVIATCRNPDSADELQALKEAGRLDVFSLDVTDHEAIDTFATKLSGIPIDVLLNNAGMIGPVPVPEHIGLQTFGTIDYELWQQVLWTNTFSAVKLSEVLLENVLASGQKKIVAISSTVGSLVERDTPAFAYATSKTALNKAMRLLSTELQEQGVSVGIICPGYVKTRMDFGTADVEIPESVAGVRQVIENLTLDNSGQYTRYNGEQIAW